MQIGTKIQFHTNPWRFYEFLYDNSNIIAYGSERFYGNYHLWTGSLFDSKLNIRLLSGKEYRYPDYHAEGSERFGYDNRADYIIRKGIRLFFFYRFELLR